MSNKKKGEFNPTVTALFPTQTGNFMSRTLDEDAIVQVNEAIGTLSAGKALFLKKGPVNSSGKNTYFLEVVDPSKFTKSSSNDL